MPARHLKRFLSDGRGATAIEYGLIAALVAVACIATFIAFGGSLQTLFGTGVEGPAGLMSSAVENL